DGSDPTTSSTNQAETPLVINSAVTVKALAVRSGYADSLIASASYTQLILSIGMNYQGGKIAYIDGTGQHGFVVAPSQGSSIWGCQGIAVGASGIGIGTGGQNTDNILAGCATSGAARIAREYTGGGYTDWNLPSKDELNLIYTNRIALGVNTSYEVYSSSEISADFAWGQFMVNGGQYVYAKSALINIMPIRYY
ncbi:MAG: FN3 associated domain-containing protein, partial [Candidatus Paceibacterota bacterium]